MTDPTPYIRISDLDDPRQGHRVFCCCNSRRGVEIINVIVIILNIIAMILLTVGKFDDIEVDVNGDPVAEQEIKELRENYEMLMLYSAIGIVVCLVGIAGARMYNTFLVSVAICIVLVDLAIYIYSGVSHGRNEEGWLLLYIFLPIVGTAIYIYPHAVFISEVKKDIMSPDNYDHEGKLFGTLC